MLVCMPVCIQISMNVLIPMEDVNTTALIQLVAIIVHAMILLPTLSMEMVAVVLV